MTLPNCAPSTAPEWLQKASPAIQVMFCSTQLHAKQQEGHVPSRPCLLVLMIFAVSAFCTARTASLLYMQAALGNPEIQEILISPTLNYVLVVLPRGTSQEQLQSIQPDFVQLKAAASYDQVSGMIVTCAGQCS